MRGRKRTFGFALALAMLLMAAPASATTYTIPSGATAVATDGVCSLLEAVAASNTDSVKGDCVPGGANDLIQLEGGTYTLGVVLNPGDPTPGETITIDRASASPVTLQQTGTNERVILVNNGTVSIDGVTVTGGDLANKAFGGGISVLGASLTLSNSTVTGNSLLSIGPNNEGDGGGIAGASGASVRLINDTVNGNTATGNGGGIDTNGSAHFELDNVTVTGNRADSDGLNGGNGGGIDRPTVSPMPLTINNSIIADNHDAGGIVTRPDCAGFGVGPLPAVTSNVIGDATGCGYTPGPGDQVGVNPLVGPLASNGGPTQTQALLAGSPALDRASAPCPVTDQRGVPRPQGSGCDIGAFELGVAAPATTTTPHKKCKKRRKKHHRAAASKKHKKKRCKKKHKRR